MDRNIQDEKTQRGSSENFQKQKSAKKASFWQITCSLWNTGLVSDIIINLIFPYPGVDYIFMPYQYLNEYDVRVPYFLSNLLLIIMVIRLRTIDIFEGERFFSDLYSETICTLHGVKKSRMYLVKMMLVHNPKAFVLTLLISSVSVLAFLLLIFEYPYLQYARHIGDAAPCVKGIGTAIYLVIITLTTVGYGDLFPFTDGGNLICVITAIWGGFMASLLVLIISNVFELTDN